MAMFLARLKPRNPRKGLVMGSHTYQGMRFTVEAGWHEVDESTADYLRTVHSNVENDESPLAFDVCTPKEAQELEDRQRLAAEQRASAANPVRAARPPRGMRPPPGAPEVDGVVTTADVHPVDEVSGEFPPDGEPFEDEPEPPPPAPVAAPAASSVAKTAPLKPGGKQRGGRGATGPAIVPPPKPVPGAPKSGPTE